MCYIVGPWFILLSKNLKFLDKIRGRGKGEHRKRVKGMFLSGSRRQGFSNWSGVFSAVALGSWQSSFFWSFQVLQCSWAKDCTLSREYRLHPGYLQEWAAPINSKSWVDRDGTRQSQWRPNAAWCVRSRLQTDGPALQLGHLPHLPCLCFFTLKENGTNCSTSLLRLLWEFTWMNIKWAHSKSWVNGGGGLLSLALRWRFFVGWSPNRHFESLRKRNCTFSPLPPTSSPSGPTFVFSQQQKHTSSTLSTSQY